MSLKAGIVGLPNVGKSTLFNAITKKNILAANYPFATIEPNVGIVFVPDERLRFLEDLYLPKSLVPTSFEFTDIAGLVKGASRGEGLGNKFLSHIRETDAIVEVVRCFDNAEITHVEGIVDPIRDIEIINIELILADLELVDHRIEKISKKAQTSKDKDSLLELKILQECQLCLSQEKPIRSLNLTKEDKEVIKSFNFITLKPIIYIANVDEAGINGNEYTTKVMEYAQKESAGVVVMCAQLESEIAILNDVDKEEYLQALNINTSGLDSLIQETYKLLGLKTFFTVGKDEVRAWTFKTGMKAPECAGIIHTDFQRGFIKAEVMSYENLFELGDEKKVQQAGKLRIEGKEYLLEDGDICFFRFNV